MHEQSSFRMAIILRIEAWGEDDSSERARRHRLEGRRCRLPASESDVSMFSSRKGGAMMFRQLFDQVSGTYSYLLASRPGGEALIIDPVLERVDRYLQLVKELDLKLVKAVDTHLHADHRPWRAARPYPLHHRDGRTD